MVMAVTDSAVVLMLVRVIVLAALTPMATSPKERLAGVNLAVVPVPLRRTCCGLPLPLSVMLIAAERAPIAAGLKSTLIVQVALTDREAPHVVAVLMNSALLVPVIAMLEMASAEGPVFLSGTFCTGLVTPTATAPKFRLVGVRVTVVPEPEPTFRKTVSSPKSDKTQLASAEPQAVRLKVTEVMFAPVWSRMPT